MRNSEKGFTLIELLAVLVILGVLLTIAVPSMSKYINNSRKESFVTAANLFIESVRNDATSETYDLPVRNNDVTIVTYDLAQMNKNKEKSSFGGKYIYNKTYVAIINIGTGTEPVYSYFYASQDSKGYAIPLTAEEKIDSKKVIANAKNKMEVTVQSLCGTKEGLIKEYSEISGLSLVQPVDEDGNKLNWNVTIYSSDRCSSNE